MLPELGQIALILALLVAALQALLPLAGAHRNKAAWMEVARPAAYAQLWLVMLAFIALTVAFVQQDFSVKYVADNSNSLLPMVYRYTAVWGSHEGSLLLWALVLAIWTGAVALFSRGLPDVVMARVLGVMGVVAVGFLAFLIFTSNPFIRLLPFLSAELAVRIPFGLLLGLTLACNPQSRPWNEPNRRWCALRHPDRRRSCPSFWSWQFPRAVRG